LAGLAALSAAVLARALGTVFFAVTVAALYEIFQFLSIIGPSVVVAAVAVGELLAGDAEVDAGRRGRNDAPDPADIRPIHPPAGVSTRIESRHRNQADSTTRPASSHAVRLPS
jgi:hypothetical protein